MSDNCPQCGEPYTIHTTGGCPRQRIATYSPEMFPGAGAARIAQLEQELATLRGAAQGIGEGPSPEAIHRAVAAYLGAEEHGVTSAC